MSARQPQHWTPSGVTAMAAVNVLAAAVTMTDGRLVYGEHEPITFCMAFRGVSVDLRRPESPAQKQAPRGTTRRGPEHHETEGTMSSSETTRTTSVADSTTYRCPECESLAKAGIRADPPPYHGPDTARRQFAIGEQVIVPVEKCPACDNHHGITDWTGIIVGFEHEFHAKPADADISGPYYIVAMADGQLVYGEHELGRAPELSDQKTSHQNESRKQG